MGGIPNNPRYCGMNGRQKVRKLLASDLVGIKGIKQHDNTCVTGRIAQRPENRGQRAPNPLLKTRVLSRTGSQSQSIRKRLSFAGSFPWDKRRRTGVNRRYRHCISGLGCICPPDEVHATRENKESPRSPLRCGPLYSRACAYDRALRRMPLSIRLRG